jgi:glycosyltransferase involved in cell wall biosynthesis
MKSNKNILLIQFECIHSYHIDLINQFIENGYYIDIRYIIQGTSEALINELKNIENIRIYPFVNNIYFDSYKTCKLIFDNNYKIIISSGFRRIDFIFCSLISKFVQSKNICMYDTFFIKNRIFNFFDIKIIGYIFRKIWDYSLVPGESQKKFSKLLGFSNSKIFTGAIQPDKNFYSTNTNNFTKKYTEKSKLKVIFVGRLVIDKGFDILIEVWKDILSEFPEAILTIVGSGPLLNNIVGIKNIEYMGGNLKPIDIALLFNEAHIFILPSRFEPWGVVVAEACSSGLPLLVSSKCGSVSDYLINNFNGYIIEPDYNSIKENLIKILNLSNDKKILMSKNSIFVSSSRINNLVAKSIIDELNN